MQLANLPHSTRWLKYDRDYLCVNKSQFVPVIFEPPCILWVNKRGNINTDWIWKKLHFLLRRLAFRVRISDRVMTQAVTDVSSRSPKFDPIPVLAGTCLDKWHWDRFFFPPYQHLGFPLPIPPLYHTLVSLIYIRHCATLATGSTVK
jgi:hypothetical protein